VEFVTCGLLADSLKSVGEDRVRSTERKPEIIREDVLNIAAINFQFAFQFSEFEAAETGWFYDAPELMLGCHHAVTEAVFAVGRITGFAQVQGIGRVISKVKPQLRTAPHAASLSKPSCTAL
jgi:hypothetical protein